MRMQKMIRKNNREYIFEKRINNKVFLYREKTCGYKECFTKFDLGLITERKNMISTAKKCGSAKI